jgi:hypothetical protein
VIELNNHRLLNGDATNRKDVEKLIGDCKVNLLLTDPPYGIDIVNIGGGKSVDKEEPQLDHSRERERERAMATIGGAKPPTFNKSRNSGNTGKTRLPKPQRGGGHKAYGKVGKPRHC